MTTPGTILDRGSPYTVFKTLFWAEFAPRIAVLRVILGLLFLLGLTDLPIWLTNDQIPGADPSSALEVDVLAKLLALVGVLYCTLHQGLRGTAARPAWQALVLPARVYQLVLPSVIFQFGTALLLGALWGLHRYFGRIDAPFSEPLQYTTVLAVLSQSAALWCAAAGAARGLPIFGLGLTVAYCAGTLAAHIGPFPPETNQAAVLIAIGWIGIILAARATRGGVIPEIDPLHLPGARPICDWYVARAARKTRFASPFWAQVWFEWRRTAWWFAAIVVTVAGLKLLVDVPYLLTRGQSLFEHVQDKNGDMIPSISGSIIFAATILFWFTHIALSGPYRRFVFSRPTSFKRVSGAKLLTACLAAAVFLASSTLSREIYEIVLPSSNAGYSPSEGPDFLSISLEAVSTAVSFFLLLVYGPFVFAGFALLYMTFQLMFESSGSSTDPGHEMVGMVIALVSTFTSTAVPFVVTGILLKRRLDFRCYPAPWEFYVTLILLPVLILFAWYEQFSGANGPGRFLIVYVGPTILAIAMTQYGRRVGLFGFGPQVGLLLVFALSFAIGVLSVEDSSSESLKSMDLATGYFIALAMSPFVIYPIAIGSQRFEPELGARSGMPSWVLFILAPVVWLALQCLGEDFSEKEIRP